MSARNHVRHGVDTEKLEAFTAFAAGNPADVRLGLGARSTYEGTCAHSLAKVDAYSLGGETIDRETREYTIPYGGWREVLDAAGWVDTPDRLEPMEAALSALASCINVGITINAVATGVDIEYLQTRVRADVDPSILFSVRDLGESDTVFENLTVEIDVESPDLDKDQIDEWARRAPVYTLVSLDQDVQLSVNSPVEPPVSDD